MGILSRDVWHLVGCNSNEGTWVEKARSFLFVGNFGQDNIMASAFGDPVETWIVVSRVKADEYEYDVDKDNLFQDLNKEYITLKELNALKIWRYLTEGTCTSCGLRVHMGDIFVTLYSTIHCKTCMNEAITRMCGEDALIFKAGPTREEWMTLY